MVTADPMLKRELVNAFSKFLRECYIVCGVIQIAKSKDGSLDTKIIEEICNKKTLKKIIDDYRTRCGHAKSLREFYEQFSKPAIEYCQEIIEFGRSITNFHSDFNKINPELLRDYLKPIYHLTDKMLKEIKGGNLKELRVLGDRLKELKKNSRLTNEAYDRYSYDIKRQLPQTQRVKNSKN